jgi:sugar phosphate isomerase/epimerase
MSSEPSRRQWLAAATASAAAMTLPPAPLPAAGARGTFRFCLNTSTISGQGLTLPDEVEITARTGYDAIEPWIHELERYSQQGNSLVELGKRIQDRGLVVADVIAFFEWIVDDPARRRKGLENARRAMDMARQLGARHIAAPPAGATDAAPVPLLAAAERYRTLLELGDGLGMVPQVEVWGFSRTLRRLGEAALVAIESGHPTACILADVYHLYKGGSGFAGLRLLGPTALQVFHVNDYPADPPRASVTDANRVYPGDGVAPLKPLLRQLRAMGFQGYLSLELFNRDYWKQDARQVAQTGLDKMKMLARGVG